MFQWTDRDRALASLRVRAQIRRQGFIAGKCIWHPDEDATVRNLYPDYAALQKALPHRTQTSLVSRVGALGIARPRHTWKVNEASRLEKLYPVASREDLLNAFPGLTLKNLECRARTMKLSRPKRVPARSHLPIINEIVDRAKALNLSPHDVDKIARTGDYFDSRCWRKRKSINAKAVFRAVAALGGRLVVRWED